MKNRIRSLVILFAMIAATVSAIKTSLIDIGAEGEYDGRVKIYRDAAANMVFKDDAHTTPITLASLSQGMRDHGDLLGLGNDDHAQYMTSGRHGSQHTSQFNDALITSPDVGNHTTLGAHLQDADRHLSPSQAETITGAWKFDTQPEFKDNIKVSHQGGTGNGDILFEDGTDDARIRWDDGSNQFDFNRKIKSGEAEMESLMVSDTGRIIGTLSGKEAQGAPSGKIENFTSIEGISSQNLVDKTADEDISGQWDFLNDMYVDGDLTTSGILNPLGGIKGLGKGNVVTVAKKGGDFSTIQAAINSITDASPTNPYVVYIFPGIYEERVTSKNYVSLIGIDRRSCKIISNQTYTPPNAHSGYVVQITNGELQNLYIENTRSSYPSVAITITDSGSINNCDIVSAAQDTLYLYGCNGARIENCKISNTLVSSGPDTISIATTGTNYFQNIELYNSGGTGVWVGNNSSTTYFMNCKFKVAGTFAPVKETDTALTLVLYFIDCYFLDEWGNGKIMTTDTGSNTTVYLHNVCASMYGNANAQFSDLGDVSATFMYPTTMKSNLNLYSIYGLSARWYADPSGYGSWQFSGDNGATWDVDLFRNGHSLKTNDAFDANSLKIGGMERISSSGGGAFAGLNNTSTFWQDFSAVSYAHGNVAGYSVIINGTEDPYSMAGWMMEGIGVSTYIQTIANGATVYFQLPYLPNSILTQLRVKWQAEGSNDGVKVRLVKRDESGTDTAWTVIGSQQTYTDPSSPYPVTVSTYNFADETMSANYSYLIEVESVKASTGVRLYSVGIESSKRVY